MRAKRLGTARSSERQGTYRVSAPAQWRALRSPLRIELIQHLRASGPSTVAELAHWLGHGPVSLYYHIRTLERVGIVSACGARRGRRQREALYDLSAQDFVYDLDTRHGEQNLRRVCTAILRMTQRDLKRTVSSGEFSLLIESRRMVAGRRTCWLTHADRTRVLRHIDSIKRIVDGSRPRPRAARHSFTIFLLPLMPKESK